MERFGFVGLPNAGKSSLYNALAGGGALAAPYAFATVDPNVAAHAQPINLHKGTLFVGVDSNVWLSEIVRYRRQEILKRMQNAFGADNIQKISFRIGA